MVTNGSRIATEWLDSVNGSLDWIALSIDSVDPNTLSRMGRTSQSGPMGEQDYLGIISMIKQHGIRLKINTVVTRGNLGENLADFIVDAHPERWKLLQVLPIEGQNDLVVDQHLISADEFDCYVQKMRCVETFGVTVVPESNELMTGSYVMVDPAGRFFDNTAGGHTYSRPITAVGAGEALNDVSVDLGKFRSRDGLYDWGRS